MRVILRYFMEIIDNLRQSNKKNYECFSTLKDLLENNEDFRITVVNGINNGKITGFSEELWNKIRTQNIRGIDNFEDVFITGANLGYCTVAAKQLSYSFQSCFLCGGTVSYLKNTVNCIDGSHTWLVVDKKILDTTLMLVIDEDYAKEYMGYIEENGYNPNYDEIYKKIKDYTNDPYLRPKNNPKKNSM